MTWIANLLVGRPLASVLVAFAFLMLHAWRRSFRKRVPVAPLVAAGTWFAYAVWEMMILALTPEANIRVDLLLIYPVLAALSLWALCRSMN